MAKIKNDSVEGKEEVVDNALIARKKSRGEEVVAVTAPLLSPATAVAAATFFSFSKVDRGGPILDGGEFAKSRQY